jgi:hypothetical protein
VLARALHSRTALAAAVNMLHTHALTARRTRAAVTLTRARGSLRHCTAALKGWAAAAHRGRALRTAAAAAVAGRTARAAARAHALWLLQRRAATGRLLSPQLAADDAAAGPLPRATGALLSLQHQALARRGAAAVDAALANAEGGTAENGDATGVSAPVVTWESLYGQGGAAASSSGSDGGLLVLRAVASGVATSRSFSNSAGSVLLWPGAAAAGAEAQLRWHCARADAAGLTSFAICVRVARSSAAAAAAAQSLAAGAAVTGALLWANVPAHADAAFSALRTAGANDDDDDDYDDDGGSTAAVTDGIIVFDAQSLLSLAFGAWRAAFTRVHADTTAAVAHHRALALGNGVGALRAAAQRARRSVATAVTARGEAWPAAAAARRTRRLSVATGAADTRAAAFFRLRASTAALRTLGAHARTRRHDRLAVAAARSLDARSRARDALRSWLRRAVVASHTRAAAATVANAVRAPALVRAALLIWHSALATARRRAAVADTFAGELAALRVRRVFSLWRRACTEADEHRRALAAAAQIDARALAATVFTQWLRALRAARRDAADDAAARARARCSALRRGVAVLRVALRWAGADAAAAESHYACVVAPRAVSAAVAHWRFSAARSARDRLARVTLFAQRRRRDTDTAAALLRAWRTAALRSRALRMADATRTHATARVMLSRWRATAQTGVEARADALADTHCARRGVRALLRRVLRARSDRLLHARAGIFELTVGRQARLVQACRFLHVHARSRVAQAAAVAVAGLHYHTRLLRDAAGVWWERARERLYAAAAEQRFTERAQTWLTLRRAFGAWKLARAATAARRGGLLRSALHGWALAAAAARRARLRVPGAALSAMREAFDAVRRARRIGEMTAAARRRTLGLRLFQWRMGVNRVLTDEAAADAFALRLRQRRALTAWRTAAAHIAALAAGATRAHATFTAVRGRACVVQWCRLALRLRDLGRLRVAFEHQRGRGRALRAWRDALAKTQEQDAARAAAADALRARFCAAAKARAVRRLFGHVAASERTRALTALAESAHGSRLLLRCYLVWRARTAARAGAARASTAGAALEAAEARHPGFAAMRAARLLGAPHPRTRPLALMTAAGSDSDDDNRRDDGDGSASGGENTRPTGVFVSVPSYKPAPAPPAAVSPFAPGASALGTWALARSFRSPARRPAARTAGVIEGASPGAPTLGASVASPSRGLGRSSLIGAAFMQRQREVGLRASLRLPDLMASLPPPAVARSHSHARSLDASAQAAAHASAGPTAAAAAVSVAPAPALPSLRASALAGARALLAGASSPAAAATAAPSAARAREDIRRSEVSARSDALARRAGTELGLSSAATPVPVSASSSRAAAAHPSVSDFAPPLGALLGRVGVDMSLALSPVIDRRAATAAAAAAAGATAFAADATPPRPLRDGAMRASPLFSWARPAGGTSAAHSNAAGLPAAGCAPSETQTGPPPVDRTLMLEDLTLGSA